jgi:CBS domain-containing protein
MKNRTVRDVMTTRVVVVEESTAFKEIVRSMEESGVGGLPVVDADGRVVGVVSEADLLLKEEEAQQPHRHHLLEGKRRGIERAKAEARVAGELMTAPAVSIGPDASLGQAARLMHERGVKRLPVVDERGVLVGIVSRGDLLTVFMRPDEDIRREVAEEILLGAMSIGPGVRVTVRDGVVTVEGLVEHRRLVPILTGLVRGVDGVVGVEDRLRYEVDDTSHRSGVMTPWRYYSPT